MFTILKFLCKFFFFFYPFVSFSSVRSGSTLFPRHQMMRFFLAKKISEVWTAGGTQLSRRFSCIHRYHLIFDHGSVRFERQQVMHISTSTAANWTDVKTSEGLEGSEMRVNFFLFLDIKPLKETMWCHKGALKIKANCRLVRRYSRYFHAVRRHDLFWSGSVRAVAGGVRPLFVKALMRQVPDWNTRVLKKGQALWLWWILGNISQRACIPLSCGGTDRGWPNNLPIPSPEMQRRQKNV